MTASTMWLASYPKSGSTWFRAVLSAWRTGAVDLGALDGAPIASSRTVFDDVLGIRSSDLTSDEVDTLRPSADDVLDRERPDGTTVRKIHDALLPTGNGQPIVSTTATLGAIYVVRDPRDVAISYAHHHERAVAWGVDRVCDPDARIAGRPDALDQQIRQRLGTWSDHVRSWVDQAPFPVHVVRYEDCLDEPVTTFLEALRFAGFDASVDDVTTAVELAAFDRLRAAEGEHGFHERRAVSTPFFRRGVSGGWRGELEPEQVTRIEVAHREVMTRFDYEVSAW